MSPLRHNFQGVGVLCGDDQCYYYYYYYYYYWVLNFSYFYLFGKWFKISMTA